MADEEELTMEKDEDAGAFYRRQLRHRDTLAYKVIAIFFGIFFLIGSVAFFLLNANKYFLPILFYDVVGAVLLVYGIGIHDSENKKRKKEEDIENLKKEISDKKYDMQVK
jgi:hypothetical protein